MDKIGKAPIGQSIGPSIGILVCWNILAGAKTKKLTNWDIGRVPFTRRTPGISASDIGSAARRRMGDG